MTALRMLIQPIHTWNDARILIVLFWALCFPTVLLILATRITFVSLPKRELRFKDKKR